MTVRGKNGVVRSKKKTTRRRRVKKKAVRRGPKKTVMSKISILEKSGLMGCLTGTGVTSKNYKDLLRKA
jgi:predicted transcriptional regulator with HTH domain